MDCEKVGNLICGLFYPLIFDNGDVPYLTYFKNNLP